MIQEIMPYAPLVLMIIMFALQYRIFMTPADFQREKASFIQYIAEHYVSDKTYREGHREVQEQLRQIRVEVGGARSDVSDIKTLLIQKGAQ